VQYPTVFAQNTVTVLPHEVTVYSNYMVAVQKYT